MHQTVQLSTVALCIVIIIVALLQVYTVSISVASILRIVFPTGLSVLEVVSIDNDVLNLQSVFQGWLHDCSTDSEHLHLTLPPTLGALTDEHSTRGLSSQITLKCDLHEMLLDPALFGGALGQKFVSLDVSLHCKLSTCTSSSSRKKVNAYKCSLLIQPFND